MKGNRGLDRRGLTLLEIMVVAALVSFFIVFLFQIMRNFSGGVVNVQRALPLQRDLQFAKSAIEKDLLSAPRSSIGNAVPEPGFETVPPRLTTVLPTPPLFWTNLPTPLDISGGLNYGSASIVGHPNSTHTGNFGLLINTQGSVGTFTAQSSTFSLRTGTYLAGVWVKTFINNWSQGSFEILGNPPPPNPPTTNLFYLFQKARRWNSVPVAGLNRWTFISNTFNADPTFNYRIAIGNASGNTTRLVVAFDDIIVTPLTFTLDATSMDTLEFDNFELEGPLAGQRVRKRYRWVPRGASGQVIRQKIDATGTITTMDPLNNIRHMSIAWDFGQSVPGMLPPHPRPAEGFEATDWNAFFANGMNFPLVVTLEAGNIGATAPNFLRLSFSVFPEMP